MRRNFSALRAGTLPPPAQRPPISQHLPTPLACVICLTNGCHCALFKRGAPSICHHHYSYLGFLICPSTSVDSLIYPCKVFSRCLNCCHKRRWHALHTFVEAFQECYKDGVTVLEDGIYDQCLESICSCALQSSSSITILSIK